MKVKGRKDYGTGQLRYGNSSWFDNELSVKWAYRDKRGGGSIKIPETPIDVLIEMVIFSSEKELLNKEQVDRIIKRNH